MMDCLHNHNPVRYSCEVHPQLARTRYTGLHALHRGKRTEWRGYYQGHIRTRAGHRLSCRLRLATIAVRERLARRAMLYILRRGWLGPEAAHAVRRVIASGDL